MNFEDLYTKYERLVWYFLKCIKNNEDREDLSQEVWLTLWQNMDKVEEGKWVPYIYSVCRNKVGNFIKAFHYKKRDAITLPIEDYDTPDRDPYGEVELLEGLRSILSETEYKICILYCRGLTQKEIAEQLHTYQPHISEKLNIIRSKVQQFIKSDCL